MTKNNWLDIEIAELRGGDIIRIVRDKVQRRNEKDGSSEYYLKDLKTSFEAQDYELIFIDTAGNQTLKVFSPAKGVYLPMRLAFTKMRELTPEEKKELEEIKISDEDQAKIDQASGKAKEALELMANQKAEYERAKARNKIYKKIYDAEYRISVDTETMNHGVYKLQKNHLRLVAGQGMSPTTILTMTIIILAVGYLIIGWANYKYNIEPGMAFWDTHADGVMRVAELNYNTTMALQGRPDAGISIADNTGPVEVPK